MSYSKEMLLACLALVVGSIHAQTSLGQAAPSTSPRTCDGLRQDVALIFEQVYEKMPSLLSVMMDAAQDPTVGKRVDFGVDVMKRMIVNAFTSFLPICAQQHQRNEQEAIKANIPAWYLSNFRSQNPVSRFYSKSGSQKQIRDSIPLKLRKKRSSGSNSVDVQIGNEFLQIGEANIPMELVEQAAQGGGGEDEEKNSISFDVAI